MHKFILDNLKDEEKNSEKLIHELGQKQASLISDIGSDMSSKSSATKLTKLNGSKLESYDGAKERLNIHFDEAASN